VLLWLSTSRHRFDSHCHPYESSVASGMACSRNCFIAP